ncbi:hypothetical protein B6I39_26015 [Klebsiella quasipneumoniae]|nr:hypothetical protein B6I39_26015 [Klebsiella quasipneumoniae]
MGESSLPAKRRAGAKISDRKGGRNHTLYSTFWQFASKLILLIKSTDNKEEHLLRIDVNGLHLTCLLLWNGELNASTSCSFILFCHVAFCLC